MQERCVIFVDNDKAKSYGSLSVITLDEPTYAYTTISDGMYPITPMDIRDHYEDLPVSAGMAIIKGGRLVKAGIMEQVKGDESLESVFLDLEGES